MILYHGTNCDFSEIDLNQTKPYKDFGQGFYLTDIQDQAFDLARKRCRIWGGVPLVQEYRFDENVLMSKELEFKELNSQYCFLTKKAIACLIRIK